MHAKVLAHRTKPTYDSAGKLARNAARRCDVPDCGYPRVGLSSMCKLHRRRMVERGHHTARAIGLNTWSRFMRHAEAFVREQLAAGHPGIVNAVEWLERESASIPPTKRAPFATPSQVYAAQWTRLRERDVPVSDVLARLVAAFLAYEVEGRLFPTDAYFTHQAAGFVLRAAPSDARLWAKRKHGTNASVYPAGGYRNTRGNLKPSHRAYIMRRLTAAIGAVALASAREIVRRLEAQRLATNERFEASILPKPVEGAGVPFLTPAATAPHNSNTEKSEN